MPSGSSGNRPDGLPEQVHGCRRGPTWRRPPCRRFSALLLPTGWSPGKHRVAAETFADPALRARPGGRDTLATKLAFLRWLPAALRLERSWTRGVPSRWPAVGTYLKARTGHDFPLTGESRQPACGQGHRHRSAGQPDCVGQPARPAGQGPSPAWSTRRWWGTGPSPARPDRWPLGRAFPSTRRLLQAVARFAAEPLDGSDRGIEDARARLGSLPGLDGEAALALLLAKAVSPSPAAVPTALLSRSPKPSLRRHRSSWWSGSRSSRCSTG